MFATNNHSQRIRPASARGGYAVRPLQRKKRELPRLSDKTRNTFEMISDPDKADLFTVQEALKAFAHVKA